MDPKKANLNMDRPNKVDGPQADEPNKRGTHGTHTAPTWLEVLIKNPDMENPCTLRLTIIEGHLQGRPSPKIRKFDGEFSP